MHTDVDVPLVVCVTRLVPQKGIHLIKRGIRKTAELGGAFVLLGSAPVAGVTHEFEHLSKELEVDYPNIKVRFLGDAKSSLGDAKSSLGDAESSLGDTKSSLGDAESSLADTKSSLADTKSSLGDAERFPWVAAGAADVQRPVVAPPVRSGRLCSGAVYV
jgi:glycosyltransferase involved in cell wall biosynthesis